MKKIKFRGKSMYSDKIIYGELTHKFFDQNTFINGEPVCFSTVAQFVGYDKNDEEIYSDDKVIDESGEEIFFKDAVINFSEIGGKFDGLKLKNENEN